MYQEKDLLSIQRQFQKRLLLLLIPVTLLMGGVIYSIHIRAEWLTDVFFILLCGIIIFSWSMLLSPVSRYASFIKNALYAKNRTTTGQFKHWENHPVKRDGVEFIPFLLNVGKMDDENDDRLFYFDKNLSLPEWNHGSRLTLTTHDKAVISWEYQLP